MDVDTLNRMVAADAALRRRQTLQPAGGKGDRIFPPTTLRCTEALSRREECAAAAHL